MEHLDSTIASVKCTSKQVEVTYLNKHKEIIPITGETFIKMHNLWLKTTPVFITDIYKNEMRNLSFAAIQKNKSSIQELSTFFSSQEDKVKLFLEYMRKRSEKIARDKEKIIKGHN